MEKIGNLHALLEEFRELNDPTSYEISGPVKFRQTKDSARDEPYPNAVPGLEFCLYPLECLPDPDHTFPELASELVSAQEAQFTELHSKQATVLILKEELQKEKGYLATIQRQITSTSKAVCFAKDEAVAAEADCTALQNELDMKTSVIEEHRLKLQRSHRAQLALEGLSVKYRENMTTHRTRTQDVEQKGSVQQELEAISTKLRELREKKLAYLSGDGAAIFDGQREEALLDQKVKINATRELLEEENSNMQQKLASGNVQLEHLRTELSLAKKKQQAQLTRLRRQLQEAQARRRQWIDKSEQLKVSIRQFKLKMEE